MINNCFYIFLVLSLLCVDTSFSLTLTPTTEVESLGAVTETTIVSIAHEKKLVLNTINTSSAKDVLEGVGADLSTKGKMKDHFRKGMKRFLKEEYNTAIPELIASTMIVDPYTWDYWYAEAYATLGVIYEFHNKVPNHKKTAYKYYQLALKRDPKTKSANYYIDRVKVQVVNFSDLKSEKKKTASSTTRKY